MSKPLEWAQTFTTMALLVAVLFVAAINARGIKIAQEQGEKTRFLICTIVSQPGSPYHFTDEVWAQICGDLVPR